MTLPVELREQLRTARDSQRAALGNGRPAAIPTGWLESAATLLAEPDPGPTPFLVDQVLVEDVIAAIQGRHKVGKTWLVLELSLAIVTGRPAFDRYEVARPGPVILVLEESGRAALHRRLDALVRGYSLEPELLAQLHFAANRRVRLDDAGWRTALLQAAREIRPRAIFLDPLARLKGSSVDENVQREMAPVLDYMRELRDEAATGVLFVQHTGHDGSRLRGTSDLEAYWESKITLSHEQGVYRLSSEHREAEAGAPLRYRFAWHEESRTVRLQPFEEARAESLKAEVLEYVRANPEQSTDAIAKGVGKRRQDVASALGDAEREGQLTQQPVPRRDAMGRQTTYHGWVLAPEGQSSPVPLFGTGQDGAPASDDEVDRPSRPPSLEGDGGPESEETG